MSVAFGWPSGLKGTMRTSICSVQILCSGLLLSACSGASRHLHANGALDAAEAAGAPDTAGALVADTHSTSENIFDGPTALPEVEPAMCGDGKLDDGEQCDDGNTVSGDGCSRCCQAEPSCAWGPCWRSETCGNGIVNFPEECDDGNTSASDGCSADCTLEPGWRCRVPGKRCLPVCGDHLRIGAETCDDGNTLDGDGCSSRCQTAPGWDCASGSCIEVALFDAGIDLGAGSAVCGDGVVSDFEECDCGDGTVPVPEGCPGPNADDVYGGCTTHCLYGPFCGDGLVNGPEECDLGSLNGDSCQGSCTLGCSKKHYCGDGIVDTSLGEQCDLGPLNGQPLDDNLNPTVAPDGWVHCTIDCSAPFPSFR